MSTGKPVKLVLMALIAIVAIMVISAAVLVLIFPDLPARLNDSGIQGIALLNWRQVMPAIGTTYNAPTPLPGIGNSVICSPTTSVKPLEGDTLEWVGPGLNASGGNDIAIEELNLTHESLNMTE
jgi:hypothetical protein